MRWWSSDGGHGELDGDPPWEAARWLTATLRLAHGEGGWEAGGGEGFGGAADGERFGAQLAADSELGFCGAAGESSIED